MLLQSPKRRRPGQIAFVSIFAILTLLLLIAVLLNTGRITSRKLDTQNAADAVGHASAVDMARSLNAITAVNHLIGELNALNALVMAYGGIPLEENKPIRLPVSQPVDALNRALQFHGGTMPEARRIPAIFQSKSGAAIGDSRKKLKQLLTWVHSMHAAGGVMAMEPALNSYSNMGKKIVKAAVALEKAIAFEWEVLNSLEQVAEKPLLDFKHISNPTMIPELAKYTVRLVEKTPQRMEHTAEKTAKEMNMTGTLFPNTQKGKLLLELPVKREKLQRGSRNHTHSQMVRSMTPWVQYWRKPVLEFGQAILPLSNFAKYYHHHSNEFTLNMAIWQQDDYDTRLYILKDLEIAGEDKGREKWTTKEGSLLCDKHFCILGIAHQPAPDVVGYPIFRQTQPDGLLAFSQGMVYGANPQNNPKKPKWQPRVGYDTLAWLKDVPEYEFGLDFKNYRKIREEPRIKINWQAKLVPATRLVEATDSQSGNADKILKRTPAVNSLANTH